MYLNGAGKVVILWFVFLDSDPLSLCLSISKCPPVSLPGHHCLNIGNSVTLISDESQGSHWENRKWNVRQSSVFIIIIYTQFFGKKSGGVRVNCLYVRLFKSWWFTGCVLCIARVVYQCTSVSQCVPVWPIVLGPGVRQDFTPPSETVLGGSRPSYLDQDGNRIVLSRGEAPWDNLTSGLSRHNKQ